MSTNCNKILICPFLSLILLSCATLKPDLFDKDNKKYINYKHNYSIKIPDDFEFGFKKDFKDKLSRGFTRSFPLKSKLIYNKHYPIYIIATEHVNVPQNVIANFTERINNDDVQEFAKKEFLKFWRKNQFDAKELNVNALNKFLNFELNSTSEILDFYLMVSISLLQPDPEISRAQFLITMVLSYPSHKDIAKEKYFTFLDGIDFNPFEKNERYK